MCREINDPGGQVRSLAGLGDTLHAMGHEEQAAAHFRQALELAIQIRSIPLLLLQFTPIGELLVTAGELELGMLALTTVARHPAAERMMQDRAQKGITRIAAARPDLLRQEGAAKQQQDDPFLVAAQLQECLTTELRWRSSPAKSQARPASVAQPGLVEALSERELEILRLLAEGLTNRQIADALTLVVGTVKAHNHHIFGKLGVSNRVQALARARELNLI
jgi:ATP/maltotriose-dependent transcriptional regulator MalT